MENFKQRILRLLQEANKEAFPSLEDVYLYDYKDIDNITEKSTFNFKKVRGSVRLSSGNVKLPSDIENLRENFNNIQLP